MKSQMKKVEAIQDWPRPLTKNQVRTFVGLTSYYRRFIPHFTSVASPLTDLTRDRLPAQVTWTEETEKAFKDLKSALCSGPVLVTPDFTKPMVVQTDASETGVGAVLSQLHEGEEHPIIFISRKLLPREQKYSTVEKECLAIKWALETLKYYLLGRHFTLVTDHAPLVWMSRSLVWMSRNQRVPGSPAGSYHYNLLPSPLFTGQGQPMGMRMPYPGGMLWEAGPPLPPGRS